MSRLRVALYGFGRTGQLVARELLADPVCELAFVVRRTAAEANAFAARLVGLPRDEGRLVSADDAQAPSFWRANPVDVIVDFSSAAAVHTYGAALEAGTRLVSAVSHYDEAGSARLRQHAQHTAVLHSPNITLGINFILVAARVLRGLAPDADVQVVEEHFRDKREVSGTALKLADALGADPASQVHSVRAGGIVGRHEVIFGLPNQTIRLVHESISRAAFGRGAIFAAKWLRERPPGLYSMEGAVREALAGSLQAIG